ncbi:hypothetical protein BD324DRAFT_625364 [Kockovaella imperatae]|uniref:Yeast cell wall synthesis Kre9/Knh1-like N-terminal domain-containing protein n=1 Tax=Kockovaella imperatae TaxID=4999 RepID=A0A1Y1UGP0_9TREE|nr:hypothetical protein BD324DRAFT_625364 [Kockovaella imperatae]ORX37233.1 hypothetical protein BD324DRAFT_625364 [Kockovaella imperatae]
MFSALSTILTLCLARSALATIYTTSPVASTVATGGQVLNVSWADDGQSPSVSQVGPCSIDIFVGSSTQQVWLQNLGESVDVSKTSAISSTINPSIGQSGDYYFIKYVSLNFKDPKNPQYPYTQYSARFTINAMTGNFNSSVMALIDSTGAPTTSAATNTAAVVVAASTVKSTVQSASASASAAKSSAKVTTAATGAAGQSFTTSATLVLSVLGMATYFVM